MASQNDRGLFPFVLDGGSFNLATDRGRTNGYIEGMSRPARAASEARHKASFPPKCSPRLPISLLEDSPNSIGPIFLVMLLLTTPALGAESGTPQTAQPPPNPTLDPVHGPANQLITEASLGYGVGAFTAIDGHDPRVTNGPIFHAALGWAWALRTNQSVGIQAFADGTWDGDRSSSNGAALASRFGGAAFVYGEHVHVRLGFGYAHATFDGGSYGGLGLGFAAGWHAPITPGSKRLMFTFDVLPSWDFLGAGSQTLHRWNFGLAVGLAVL